MQRKHGWRKEPLCGTGSHHEIRPGESPENGREELTFPAPSEPVHRWSDYPGGTCHRLPRTGSHQDGDANQGVWRPAVVRKQRESKSAARTETNREPSYVPQVGFPPVTTDTVGEKPAVATVSQCGGLSLTVSDHRKAVQRPRLRNRSTQGGQDIAE
jgi:hypothetical protein